VAEAGGVLQRVRATEVTIVNTMDRHHPDAERLTIGRGGVAAEPFGQPGET
jgi:hypothetical protein